MGFVDWVKKDISKLGDPKVINKVAMGLGLLSFAIGHVKDKNDYKTTVNDAADEVMKRLASKDK